MCIRWASRRPSPKLRPALSTRPSAWCRAFGAPSLTIFTSTTLPAALMDTFTPVLSRNVSWFLFRFLITAAVCACVCVCLYTGSSPPTGPSSLLTYFTQNVAAVSANTGASVSNGLNSLIDAGSSLIKGVLVFLVIRIWRKPACSSRCFTLWTMFRW
jgi:hypothetical protein